MVLRSPLSIFLDTRPEVSYVRLQWLDLSGILRCRIFSKAHCETLESAHKPLSAGPVSMICLVDGSRIDAKEASGTIHFWPDWQSLRVTNFQRRINGEKRYASVMCSLIESTPLYPDIGSQRCPRSLLYHVLEEAKNRHGLTFLAGFETEFIVAERTEEGGLQQRDVNPGGNAVAGCQSPNFRYVEESVEQLQEVGIQVEQFHAEGDFGQYEISTEPLPPMAAIDALVSTRDTIKNVCSQHGVLATMHPKPFASHPATGAHAHLSMDPSVHEEHFVAGILRRMPILCAFSMANYDSYERRGEAGTWVSWGTQCRDVPLRKISAGHWEIRNVDASANTYLFLAAFIAAGLLGVQNSEPLLLKDSTGWSSTYTAEQRQSLGMDRPMPENLSEVLERLDANDDGLAGILGPEIIKQYVYLKKRECELVRGWDAKSRVNAYSRFF